MPSIAKSSGYPILDSAAIDLAKAGSGHYSPAMRDGVALPGCGSFEIRFHLQDDPRWPTISHKLGEINGSLWRGIEVLRRELVPPPALTKFSPGDAEQVVTLRQSAAIYSAALDQIEALESDYLASIERVSSAYDVPEVERRAFKTYWADRSAAFQRRFADLVSSARRLLRFIDELADYAEATQRSLSRPSGPVTPMPRQRLELDSLMGRGRTEYEEFRAASRALAALARRGFGNDASDADSSNQPQQ